MTNEEAIKILNSIDFCNGNVCDSCHMGCRCSDIDKVKTMAIKALEQTDVLEKVRAEILQVANEEKVHDEKWALGLRYAVNIIDKYRRGGAE